MGQILQAVRRASVTITLLVLSALLLAACPGAGTAPVPTPEPGALPEAPAEAAPPVAADEPAGTIRVAVVRGAMSETMRRLADQFQAENPGVTVTIEEEPEGGAFDALIAAGNQPDLIVVSFGSLIGRLAAGGAVLPLDEMPSADELFARLEPATVEAFPGRNHLFGFMLATMMIPGVLFLIPTYVIMYRLGWGATTMRSSSRRRSRSITSFSSASLWWGSPMS